MSDHRLQMKAVHKSETTGKGITNILASAVGMCVTFFSGCQVEEFWRAETCSCHDSRDSVENGKVWGCCLCWGAFDGIGSWPALQMINQGHVLKEAEV